MTESGGAQHFWKARLVVSLLLAAIGSFVVGIVAGPFLLPPPLPEDPGEVAWPILISVDFEDTPEDAVLRLAVTVVRENATLGSAFYVVSRPLDPTEEVMVFMNQSLEAVSQSLMVLFEWDEGSSGKSYVDVSPDGPFASPRLEVSFTWGAGGASHMPVEGENWELDIRRIAV